LTRWQFEKEGFMKTHSVLALGLLVGLCIAHQGSAAVQFNQGNDRRGDQVCVYKDINYFGAEQCYRAGEEINNLGSQNNSISSIRVYGRAMVTVYEKATFSGRSAQFTSDVSDLGQRAMAGNTSWSDRIVSLRIAGTPYLNDRNSDDRSNSGVFGRNQPRQPRDGICVYDRPNYEGRSECWNVGQNVSDLSRQGGWNGQISSIRLFGDRTIAVVYQDIAYRGESLTVDRDIPDLQGVQDRSRGNGNGNGNGRGRGNNGRNAGNWVHQISSLQVQLLRPVR
jgi:hypothetical protein